jgi:acetyl-CoA carboxylase carboxyltransferase component
MEDTQPSLDGLVTGDGEVDGRQVFVFAADFTLFGGSPGEAFTAIKSGVPIVGLNDSAGVQIQEAIDSHRSITFRSARGIRISLASERSNLNCSPSSGSPIYRPWWLSRRRDTRGIRRWT